MRAQPHQIEVRRVRLSIDEHEVRPDVAVAVVGPVTGERVIEISARQLRIGLQQIDRMGEVSVERLAMPPGLLALVVALEAVRVPNRPQ